jgi:hypothetical protein
MHIHDNPQAKKILWILFFAVLIVFFILGTNEWQSRSKTADAHACAINFLNTFVFNASTSTTPTAIAHTLLEQLLDAYKNVPDCPTLGITNYSITSVGKATFTSKDFSVPATFDVVPLSKDKTLWAMASTTWDGAWIRGEKVTLGIQNVSTTTLQSYRLVLK